MNSAWSTLGVVVRKGSYAKGFDTVAKDIGSKPTPELIRLVRNFTDNVWVPPTLGVAAPLTDVMVHTQDIARPLGIEVPVAPDEIDPVLTFAVGNRSNQLFVPSKRYRKLRLIATDLKWKYGKGAEVEGPGLELLMALAGRKVGLEQLTGDGVPTLANRI